MALAEIRSKAMVLVLFIYCLLLLPLDFGDLCLVLLGLFISVYASSFAIILMGKRELVALLNCLPDVLTISVL